MHQIAKLISLVLLLLLIHHSPSALAADTGLCPPGYKEGTVTTGYVDCHRESSPTSNRANAEIDRLAREAVCIAEPRGEVYSSVIVENESGNFFSRITCRVGRVVAPDTVLCPADSDEIFRAYSSLVCQYFGSAANTEAAAIANQADIVTACTSAVPPGSALLSSIKLASSANSQPYFYSELSCGFAIPAIDVFVCPVGFFELSRTEDLINCIRRDFGLLSLAGAQTTNQGVENLCVNTTAGLGEVTFSSFSADTSGNNTFFSEVECEINIPRYGNFVNGAVIRACDASCTEEIEQTRACLNDGVPGQPGCIGPATQVISKKCNTGTSRDSACPLMGIPAANIVPLLLLDDDT